MTALSIVIPAFNEAGRLGPTLEAILTYLERRGVGAEVLVVDDGSRDGTAEVAARYFERQVRTVRLPENRGKGAAVSAGVLASHGERVLLCDADLSTPIEEIERLEAALAAGAQLAFGSREAAGAEIAAAQPFFRVWMGRAFNGLLHLLGFGGLRDTQCGFKLLDGGVARRLFAELTVERFAYDVELLWLARRAGFRVVEVGVRWAHVPASRVHPFYDSLSMLRDVVRLRLRHLGRSAKVPESGR